MSFFKNISKYCNDNSTLKIFIRKKGDLLTIMLPDSETNVPLIISGTADSLDKEFFTKISTPMEYSKSIQFFW